MQTLYLETCLQRNAGQVFTEMDGEIVMLNVEKGSYFGISGSGSRIWELLEKPKTVADIVSVVIKEYEVEQSQCEEDVLSFCEALVENEMVSVVTNAK